MDLENFGGASEGATIGFWKHWGGHGPPGLPGLVSTGICNTFPRIFLAFKMILHKACGLYICFQALPASAPR